MASQNKKRFMNGCFCGDWVDVEVQNFSEDMPIDKSVYAHKDLDTLLAELEEIKKNIERIAEKKEFLENLVRYNNELYADS